MAPAPTEYAQSPEALVVALARTGDRDAFGQLVIRRQAWIRNLMRRCCGDDTLADDLAQQVFLQAWRDISKIRDPQKFAGWLKLLAINTWRQHLRKNDPLRGAEEESEDQSASTPAPAGLAMDLDAALAELEAVVRTCVVLSYHEGMSHSEISTATKLPVGTVKSHIRRGSQRLKELLSAYTDKAPGEVT